jgi:hypothetical protein
MIIIDLDTRRTLMRGNWYYQLCNRGESLCECVYCEEPAAVRCRPVALDDWLYLCREHHKQPSVEELRELLL